MKRDKGDQYNKKVQGRDERQRRQRLPTRLTQTNTLEKESFQDKDKSGGGEEKEDLLGKRDGDIRMNVPIILVILV